MRSASRPKFRQGSLGVSIAILLVATALGKIANADTPPPTITLATGSGTGSPGDPDPNITYTIVDGANAGSAGQAVIDSQVSPDFGGYSVIDGTQWVSVADNGTDCQPNDASGTNETPVHTNYDYSFTLPPGARPSLSMQLLADNAATVFLNGDQIAQQPQAGDNFDNFQVPTAVTADASHFVAGTNTLRVQVADFALCNGVDYLAQVEYTADLAAAVTASPSGVPPASHAVAGGPIEDYHVVVTNNGPSDAVGGYVATAQLPDGTSFNPSNTDCTLDGVTITCDRTGIGTLPLNATDEFHVYLDLQPSIGDAGPTDETTVTFTVNLGTFGTPQPPDSTANDQQHADVTVYSESDLTIVKSVSTPAGTPASTIYANTDPTNSKVVFHISVTNGGVSDAHNVVIHDTLDPDLLTGAVCSGGPECPVTYAGTITIGTLAAGATKSFDIEAHANANLGHSTHTNPTDRAPGPYTNHNTASVDSSTPAHNPPDTRSSGPFSTTIDTIPGSPVIRFTIPGQTDAGIEWTAPSSNGGRPITQYHVVATPCPSGGASCTVVTNNNVPNASIGGTQAFSYVIPGLTTNTTYRFDVFATNVVGDSDPAMVFVTPNISADNNIIPATGSASVDTGVSGGALSTCPGGDPSSPTCKNIVGQYSLSAPGDAGSLFGLSTVPNSQSIQTTLSFVAARNLAATSAFGPSGPCYEVDFTTASIVSPADCNVVANKAVLSTYPTTKATLTTPHLETTQYDTAESTAKLGAPCFVLRTDPRFGRKNAVIVDANGRWSCLVPSIGDDRPMPECPEGVGWTKAKPCAYLYYSVVDIHGYDLHPNSFWPPSVRPTACTSGTYCGAPVIIGGSMALGIQFVERCTNPFLLSTCSAPVQIKFNGVPSQVRPWCFGRFPNFAYLPCVSNAQWLNKSSGNNTNDIKFQEYMTGDPGGRKTG